MPTRPSAALGPSDLLDLGRYDLRLLSESEQFEIERLLLRPTGDPAERARRDALLAKAERSVRG